MENTLSPQIKNNSILKRSVRIATDKLTTSIKPHFDQNQSQSNIRLTHFNKNILRLNKFTKFILSTNKTILNKTTTQQKSTKTTRTLPTKKLITQKKINKFYTTAHIIDTQNQDGINSRYNTAQISYQLNLHVIEIYKQLHLLQKYGFSQQKITNWMTSYLSTKPLLIKNLFIKSHLNKKSLNNTLTFSRIKTSQKTTIKIQQLVNQLTLNQKIFLINQVRNFKNYMENIVIKKTQENLNQIFQNNQFYTLRNYHPKNYLINSSEVRNFVQDLNDIQGKFGELYDISKLNRIMFKQVLKAEEKLANFGHLRGQPNGKGCKQITI